MMDIFEQKATNRLINLDYDYGLWESAPCVQTKTRQMLFCVYLCAFLF